MEDSSNWREIEATVTLQGTGFDPEMKVLVDGFETTLKTDPFDSTFA